MSFRRQKKIISFSLGEPLGLRSIQNHKKRSHYYPFLRFVWSPRSYRGVSCRSDDGVPSHPATVENGDAHHMSKPFLRFVVGSAVDPMMGSVSMRWGPLPPPFGGAFQRPRRISSRSHHRFDSRPHHQIDSRPDDKMWKRRGTTGARTLSPTV